MAALSSRHALPEASLFISNQDEGGQNTNYCRSIYEKLCLQDVLIYQYPSSFSVSFSAVNYGFVDLIRSYFD